MSNSRFLYLLAAALPCMAVGAQSMDAQTSAQLFGSTFVRASTIGAATTKPLTFNSATVNLTCTSGTPIKAVLSSSSDGLGNLLVDNFVQMSVTIAGVKTGPTEVCRGGTSEGGQSGTQQNCFNSNYQSTAATLLGADLTGYAATGGIAPIDVSGLLSAGTQQVTIDLVDTGSLVTNAPVYLITSCTQGGVTGPATITGNPIPAVNPPAALLTQDFTFNSAPTQTVGFTYDLATSQQNGNLQLTSGTIPSTQDMPLDPALWQKQYAIGTSFATSSCMVHRGELLNGQSACKLYTLTCQVGTGATSAGALCPVSQLRDEVFSDQFTGPAFLLPDITGPTGKIYHQGVGLLMAAENWTGGPCTFDSASGLQAQDCPQNLLTFFSSPGVVASASILVRPRVTSFLSSALALDDGGDEELSMDGTGTHPNSTFLSVSGVPEDLTTVSVTGQHPGGWVNTHTVKVGLSSEPPLLPDTVPNYQNFLASPIQSITYGLSPASTVLSTKFAIPGDVNLANASGCPTPANPSSPLATVFAPPTQTLTGVADGQYLLHYFAQDCAGTEELKFSSVGKGGWSTSFFTVPINVDTVIPVVSSGPVLSPLPTTIHGKPNSYVKNQHVSAAYSCTDDAAGVATCGTSSWSGPGTLNTGVISSPVDTSTVGAKTYTVQTTDAAGNVGTPVTVKYNVENAQADMVILQLAPDNVKTGTQLKYELVALNLGPDEAKDIVIKDVLPAGTSFVSAGLEDINCVFFSVCNAPPPPGSCSFSAGTLTCNVTNLKALSWTALPGIGVNLVVSVTASAPGKLTNTATVQSVDVDSNPGNNISIEHTSVHK
jgi:uncharacterized repeat protein (TIGR01451 family)